MSYMLFKKMKKFLEEKRKDRIWRRAISAISVIVMITTAYILIYPAIAATSDGGSDNIVQMGSELSTDPIVTTGSLIEMANEMEEGDPMKASEEEVSTSLGGFFMANALFTNATTSDFTSLDPYLTSVTINGGQTIDPTKLNIGSLVSFHLEYTLPKGTLKSEENSKRFRYLLPKGIKFKQSLEGDIEHTGYTQNTLGRFHLFMQDDRAVIELRYNQNAEGLNVASPLQDGYVNFEASVAELEFGGEDVNNGQKVIEFSNSVSVTVQVQGDINITKTGALRSGRNDVIDYTVRIGSNWGTGGAVTFNDAMWEMKSSYYFDSDIHPLSVKRYRKQTGYPVIEENITNFTAPSIGDTNFNIDLERMKPGDVYEITFSSKVNPDQKFNYNEIKNNATVTSSKYDIPHVSGDLQANSTATLLLRYEDSNIRLEKRSTFVEEENRIKWTLTVDPNGENLRGIRIDDQIMRTLLGGNEIVIHPDYSRGVQIKNKNPSKNEKIYSVSPRFPFVLDQGILPDEDMGDPIEITYYSKDLESFFGGEKITNTAKLVDTYSNRVIQKAKVEFRVSDWLTKQSKKESVEYPSFTDPDHKVADITWEVSIGSNMKTMSSGWVYEDGIEMNDGSHYMTPDQLEQLRRELNSRNIQVQLQGILMEGYSDRYGGFKIISTGYSIPRSQKFKFSYQTRADIGDGTQEKTFYNRPILTLATGDVLNYPYSSFWKYRPASPTSSNAMRKSDSRDPMKEFTVHQYYDEDSLKTEMFGKYHKMLKWQLDFSGIPDGIDTNQEYIKIEEIFEDPMISSNYTTNDLMKNFMLKIERLDNYAACYNIFLEKNNWSNATVYLPEMTTINVHTQVTEGKLKISINLPMQMVTDDEMRKKVKLCFYVKLPEEDSSIWTQKEGYKDHVFTNKMIAKPTGYNNGVSWEGDKVAESVQSQRVVIDPAKPIVKSGTYDSGARELNYTLEVNPTGKNLVDGDQLLIKDILKHKIKSDREPLIAELDDVLIDGRPIKDVTDCRYTYRPKITQQEGNYEAENELIFYVPDSKKMTIKYKYKLKTPQTMSDVSFSNSARIEEVVQGYVEDNNKLTIEVASASAGASMDPNTVMIIKVDEHNHSKTLSGARFKLYKLENDSSETPVMFPDSDSDTDTAPDLEIVSNSEGKVLMTGLEFNKVYRWEETGSPMGYSSIRSSGRIYIYDPDTFNDSDVFAGAVRLQKRQPLYITNRKNIDITVQKHWRKEDGSPHIPDASISRVEMELWRRTDDMSEGEKVKDFYLEKDAINSWQITLTNNEVTALQTDGTLLNYRYYVKEKTALLSYNVTYQDNSVSGQDGTIKVINTYADPADILQTNLQIYKYDINAIEDEDVPLKGAKFRLGKYPSLTSTVWQPISTASDNLETGEDGFLTYDKQELRKYTKYFLYEVKLPEGYDVPSALYARPKSGINFVIYDGRRTLTQADVGEGNGLPTLLIRESNITKIPFSNKKRQGEIKIKKEWKVKLKNGAEEDYPPPADKNEVQFELYRETYNVNIASYITGSKRKVKDIKVTRANDWTATEPNIPLKDGTNPHLYYHYSIVETDTPQHYTTYIEALEYEGGEPSWYNEQGKTEGGGIFLVQNKINQNNIPKRNGFVVEKLGEFDTVKLNGATFSIQKGVSYHEGAGGKPGTWNFETVPNGIKTTQDGGRLIYDDLEFMTPYRLVETKAPGGYVTALKPEYYFYFDHNAQNTTIPENLKNFRRYGPVTDENDPSTYLRIKNKKEKIDIEVTKEWKNEEGTTYTPPLDKIGIVLKRKTISLCNTCNPIREEIYDVRFLNASEDWTHIYSELPTSGQDENGFPERYSYAVEEIGSELDIKRLKLSNLVSGKVTAEQIEGMRGSAPYYKRLEKYKREYWATYKPPNKPAYKEKTDFDIYFDDPVHISIINRSKEPEKTTHDVIVTKKNEKGELLKGIKFNLYEGLLYDNKTSKWTYKEDPVSLTTGENGVLNLGKLKYNTVYKLKEDPEGEFKEKYVDLPPHIFYIHKGEDVPNAVGLSPLGDPFNSLTHYTQNDSSIRFDIINIEKSELVIQKKWKVRYGGNIEKDWEKPPISSIRVIVERQSVFEGGFASPWSEYQTVQLTSASSPEWIATMKVPSKGEEKEESAKYYYRVKEEIPMGLETHGMQTRYRYYIGDEEVQIHDGSPFTPDGLNPQPSEMTKFEITNIELQENVFLNELPETGGSGTGRYLLGGIMLLLLAFLLYIDTSHIKPLKGGDKIE